MADSPLVASPTSTSSKSAPGDAPVICLMGPTASGKSQLAIELAQTLDGEIINVDSALVYRGMDIGTAKPTLAEMQGIAHHLIDIREPNEPFSVAEFRESAIAMVNEIRLRNKRPILVGGTMLYFKALKDGLAKMPAANPVVREAILQQGLEKGWPDVHEALRQVDPKAAARINPNDPQRLQRALEVYRVSGRSLSYWQEQEMDTCPFELLEIAIFPPDRALLHKKIEQRFHQMLQAGFEDEVIKLRARGDLSEDLPSIKSVGYRQMWSYLSDEYDFQTMTEKAIVATRQLAKRQFTWLRGWKDLRLLASPARSEALKILS